MSYKMFGRGAARPNKGRLASQPYMILEFAEGLVRFHYYLLANSYSLKLVSKSQSEFMRSDRHAIIIHSFQADSIHYSVVINRNIEICFTKI